MTPEREREIRDYIFYPTEVWQKATLADMGIELLAEIDRLRGENGEEKSISSELILKYDQLREKLAVAVEALEFYTLSPYYFPDGFYELNIKQSEGGHVRFGTKAREALSKIKGEK